MKRSTSLLLLALAVLVAAEISPASAGPASDWPAYLYNAKHTSKSASVAITPANAGALGRAWTFTAPGPTMTGQPGNSLIASPIVYGGRIYIGANTGVFYALKEGTGTTEWSRFLGFSPKLTCNARGIASTATVAIDPATLKPTVYVSSGDGYLFALDAATGGVVWQSEIHLQTPGMNDYFDWSSPTVANGRVYVGVSSQCDTPLVRAGVKSFDQVTGAPRAEYFSLPAGETGGSVWSSVAVTAKAVYATTGNATAGLDADAYSVVKLDATTLARRAAYTVPGSDRVPDSDFGASPVMFTGGGVSMVGACNKGGYFYAVRASDMSFRWKQRLATGSPSGSTACLAAGVWDGSRLFLSGPLTQIGGVDYRGSVRQVDPATGNPVWETGLPGVVIGTPSINGSGVIAAPIFEFDSTLSVTYLLDASTGGVVRFLPGGTQFAQPTFAGRYLFTAAQTGGVLTAWKLP